MAGQGYNVTPPELRSGSAKAATAREEVNSLLSNLHSALTPLEADWQDDASVSFAELMSRYTDAQTKLENALQGISETLTQSADNYDEEEATNQAGFQQMSGAFPGV